MSSREEEGRGGKKDEQDLHVQILSNTPPIGPLEALIESVPNLSDDPLSAIHVKAALSSQSLEDGKNPGSSGSVDLGGGDDERPGEAATTNRRKKRKESARRREEGEERRKKKTNWRGR